MGIKDSLGKDMITAMKAKEAERLSTIRMMNSVIKNKEIDQRRELSEEELQALIATAVKQRRESIEQFKAAGRQELVDKEEAEIAILLGYLPQQLSTDEIKKIVTDAVSESGAVGPKDMGKVMKIIMPKTRGKADGAVVNQLVKEALGG